MKKLFKYEWHLFNARIGLIFMVGVLLVFNLMEQFDFAMYAGAFSALLAWMTVILVPGRQWFQHLFGLLAYLVIGIALTILADVAAPYIWARLASMAIVTFIGYLFLLRGMHPFMVAWCLVYWYLLVPLFLAEKNLNAVLLGHCVGAGLVIALNLVKPIWLRATNQLELIPEDNSDENQALPSVGFVVRYAAIVSISIVTGLAAGLRWLAFDPTLIANATINMISPSLEQTWHAAIERIIVGTLGVVGGFYCGWFFPEPWMGNLVTAICAFLALGVLYINMALVVGILFFLISYSWGSMQSDLAHQIANEKIVVELTGIVIAVIAIAILTYLNKKRQ